MSDKEAMDVLLNTAFTVTEKNADKVEFAIRAAINALDKRIPKQPLEQKTLDDGMKYGLCPSCENIVLEADKSCNMCGQAIDWGKDDQNGEG